MYLHSRNCKDDFLSILKQNRHKFSTGVVHSYTGDSEELEQLLKMGLYIGVNGCSFKTE
jgi:TatD DNase family protein